MQEPKLFDHVMKHYPAFIRQLVEDLLRIESYNANDIAFASNIGIDIIRDIAYGKIKALEQKEFFKLLKLYSYVFCDSTLSFD